MAGRPLGIAKTGGRQKGTPNRNTSVKKEATQDFFARIIDDELEAKFWRYFTTGYEALELPDGRTQIVPIPLNPVAFQAFKRAVEYKRGMPVQPQYHIGTGEDGALKVRIEHIFSGSQGSVTAEAI